MKNKILVDHLHLDTDKEYSIQEIQEKIRLVEESEAYSSFKLFPKLIAQVEYDYGETYVYLRINFYREETDEEHKKRLDLEEQKRLKGEELDRKRKDRAQKRKEVKIQKEQERLKDPEYLKFLELQKKFEK